MFIITYDEQRGIYYYRNITESFKDRNEANSRWVELKKNPLIANMRHSVTEEPEQTYIAVQVVFKEGGRKYTYLYNEPVEIGQLVVIKKPYDPRDPVKYIAYEDKYIVLPCVGCSRVTKSQLEAILPFNKYKYITGKVV